MSKRGKRNRDHQKAKDGEEVHYLTHEPVYLTELGKAAFQQVQIQPESLQVPIGGSTPFKITLKQEFFPTVKFGNYEVRRDLVEFVGYGHDQTNVEGAKQVILSFPIPGPTPDTESKVKVYFYESPVLWGMFPEIAQQLGKP